MNPCFPAGTSLHHPVFLADPISFLENKPDSLVFRLLEWRIHVKRLLSFSTLCISRVVCQSDHAWPRFGDSPPAEMRLCQCKKRGRQDMRCAKPNLATCHMKGETAWSLTSIPLGAQGVKFWSVHSDLTPHSSPGCSSIQQNTMLEHKCTATRGHLNYD